MSEQTNNDRRSIRHQETKLEILAAAWELVREKGLAGLSMRDLGGRVGMKAQSLYSYFSSKTEIYDAMFRQGYEAFIEEAQMEAPVEAPDDVQPLLHQAALRFFDFCTSDPARFQLLFQRTIPDFVPSDESFTVAVAAYGGTVGQLARLGIDGDEARDLWTAVLTGLASQQLANDPGGRRWRDLAGRAVSMLVTELADGAVPADETVPAGAIKNETRPRRAR